MNSTERIQPPRLKDGKKNLQQIAVTTSSQVVAIDPQLLCRWVRIKAKGGDVAFYFRSDNSGSVDQTLATSVGPTEATLGYQILSGGYEDFMLSGQDLYIVIDGSAACTVQILGSGPRRVVDGPSAGP